MPRAAKKKRRPWSVTNTSHQKRFRRIRAIAIGLLLEACGDSHYARECEEAVYLYSASFAGRPEGYTAKIKDILERMNKSVHTDLPISIMVGMDPLSLEPPCERTIDEGTVKFVPPRYENTDYLPAMERCRRCRSSDVEVRQQQTRSADEGITNFLTCRNCLAKWKL